MSNCKCSVLLCPCRSQLESASLRNEADCTQFAEKSHSAVFTDIQSVIGQIEKDVVRTDRSHPYYKGEENVHVQLLM